MSVRPRPPPAKPNKNHGGHLRDAKIKKNARATRGRPPAGPRLFFGLANEPMICVGSVFLISPPHRGRTICPGRAMAQGQEHRLTPRWSNKKPQRAWPVVELPGHTPSTCVRTSSGPPPPPPTPQPTGWVVVGVVLVFLLWVSLPFLSYPPLALFSKALIVAPPACNREFRPRWPFFLHGHGSSPYRSPS